MSAQLIFHSGDGDEFCWIDVPMLRIGSGADCDVRIADRQIESHVFTLEYWSGKYVVHNRSSDAIDVNGGLIKPGSSAPLANRQSVTLNEDLSFTLQIDGDPAPSPAPEGDSHTGEDADLPVDAEEEADEIGSDEIAGEDLEEDQPHDDINSSPDVASIMQVAVIGICFVAIAVILISKFSAGKSSTPRTGFPLIHFVSAPKPGWQAGVAKQLQRAEIARMRGRSEEAFELWYQLRDAVKSPPNLSDKEFANEVGQFIIDRAISVGAQ